MEKWVKTAGQRLAELLAGEKVNSVQGHDLARLHKIADSLNCKPDRATVIDFKDGDADFIHKMYSLHGA